MIKDLTIKYANRMGFAALDDYIWFQDCRVEWAGSAGFYWIHYIYGHDGRVAVLPWYHSGNQ